MKTTNPFKIFFLTALISGIISLLVYFYNSSAYLDLMVFDINIHVSYSNVWELFCVYLLILSAVYFMIDSSSLKTNNWLVRAHYSFVFLFLFGFIGFSLFDVSGYRTFISVFKIPAMTIISVYAVLLLTDITLLFGGLILLALNLFSLKKEKPE